MKDRTTQTLTRIIQKRIRYYNIIYSNSWKEPVKEINYVHQTVNYSVNFADPESGVHTQNIKWL